MTTQEKNKNNIQVVLVGSPNSGKTTLFNALTGSRQKTGNYPGVTVERKEGFATTTVNGTNIPISILDLPGLYSLTPRTPDEAITAEIVRGIYQNEQNPDLIIAVADATNLERHLYLITELRELGLPMIVVLTMMDLVEKSKISIDVKKLEHKLGVPIVATASKQKRGLTELLRCVAQYSRPSSHPDFKQGLPQLPEVIQARYRYIDDLIKNCIHHQTVNEQITKKIDRIVLHKFFGPLILIAVFALMFQMIFQFAKIPTDYINAALAQLGFFFHSHLPPSDLTDLFVNGVINGVGAVVAFLPQILILFTFILIFEDSGYLARAAFILDRIMAQFGLNGRAFIPLLSSFACAVPGIMSTRTIESRRDRLITILVSPLMTCSARLPIYTLLISTFIPDTKIVGFFHLRGLVMLGLYLFGILAALLVAGILSHFVLQGDSSSFLIELPSYKRPSLRNLFYSLYERARIFLYRAGTIILAASVLLWALATYPKVTPPPQLSENAQASYRLQHSIIGRMGQAIEPFVEPLGYDWKIGMGLISSFAAREVILSTLGTIYAVESNDESHGALAEQLQNAKNDKTGAPVFTLPTVLSLLVFYMLACQCMSTLAITKRETNSWRWPFVMFTYMTVLAYSASYCVFHGARWLGL